MTTDAERRPDGTLTALPELCQDELAAKRGFDYALAAKLASNRRREPVPITDSIGIFARPEGKPKTKRKRNRVKRRIPTANQQVTRQLLRSVDGLSAKDAHDLATIGTTIEFRRAVEHMPEDTNNPGGWLRSAVTEGWYDG